MVSLRRTWFVWAPSGHWRRTRGALYVFHVMFVLYSCQGARDCKPALGGKPDQRGGPLSGKTFFSSTHLKLTRKINLSGIHQFRLSRGKGESTMSRLGLEGGAMLTCKV